MNGEGFALLDPHGDLVDHVLGFVPPNRQSDLVYFNVPIPTVPSPSIRSTAGQPSLRHALAPFAACKAHDGWTSVAPLGGLLLQPWL